ncbi:Hypothetical protein FKW44_020542 [Caligus rogercresseyi]|uniref:Uncharacterized protein n=1 Tax=Caligus rogercresseyi TaxID=217165 RepID=A0A7T8GXG4_CALRO|nr:Hypothetical protein FKW44_020542 [Caligus rogercresseyi]
MSLRVNAEVYQEVLRTVVKPWTDTVAGGATISSRTLLQSIRPDSSSMSPNTGH